MGPYPVLNGLMHSASMLQGCHSLSKMGGLMSHQRSTNHAHTPRLPQGGIFHVFALHLNWSTSGTNSQRCWLDIPQCFSTAVTQSVICLIIVGTFQSRKEQMFHCSERDVSDVLVAAHMKCPGRNSRVTPSGQLVATAGHISSMSTNLSEG